MKIKAKKGCVNPECIKCKKQKHAHKDDLFCSICGKQLLFVCEKCQTVLEDGTVKLCVSCQAMKDDTNEKRKKTIGKVGALAAPVISVVTGVTSVVIKKK